MHVIPTIRSSVDHPHILNDVLHPAQVGQDRPSGETGHLLHLVAVLLRHKQETLKDVDGQEQLLRETLQRVSGQRTQVNGSPSVMELKMQLKHKGMKDGTDTVLEESSSAGILAKDTGECMSL